ncbi:MAG: substrate-binding domain-containing protein [Bacteroidota bacterium]|jgi:ABC-type nitrate/sulfonate/bicarbonate transport system substrate-binding protein|nr:substrate-binding domain-containing protein [Bacteroidota bacterium]
MSKIVHFNIGGVPEHFNLPWQIALERGLFKENFISVKWHEYPGGTGAMTKDLRNNKLDVAVLLTEGIVADIINGNPCKIISQYVSSPLIWGIHVPADSGFQNIEDIKGKRYAISRPGSGSHLMAFVDAQQRGWSIEEDQLVIVGNMEGARKAFKDNDAEIFLWEKFMTKPLVDSGEFSRIGECPTPWPCFVIAAREEIIEKNPLALKKLIEVISDASVAFMKNPKAAELAALKFNLILEDAVQWHKNTKWQCGDPLSKDDFERVVDDLFLLNFIEKKPSYESVCITI